MKNRYLYLVTVAAVAMWNAPLLAQTTDENRSKASTSQPELGDIIVTANKVEQRLLDVPVAVTAFSSIQRDRMGLTTTQDIAAFTPSMSFSNDPPRVFLRGVGQNAGQRSADPGVGLYYDGVYSVNAAAISTPSIITERIEVLRGPQGTLYGKNTTGGAINIIAKRPTKEFTGEFREDFGNYERSVTGLTLSGPITDTVRFRLTGTYNWQGRGFIRNIVGDDMPTGRSYTLEAQVEADLTPNLNFWAKYAFARTDQLNEPASFSFPYITAPETIDGLNVNPLYNYDVANPGIANRRTTALDVAPSFHGSNHQVTAHLDWNISDHLALRYIGGYNTAHAAIARDLDNSARTEPFVDTDPTAAALCGAFGYSCLYSPITRADITGSPETFSNELNLISSGNDKLDYTLGLYQYWENAPFTADLRRPGQPALQPVQYADNPGGTYIYSFGAQKNLTLAGFGQADYHLDDQWTVEAGFRYSYDKKEVISGLKRLTFSDPLTGFILCGFTSIFCDLITPATAPPPDDFKRNFTGWSGRLSLQWQPDEQTNAYALISRGYKAGAITVPGKRTFIPPETVIDYEVGLKKQFGRTLLLNLAAFYYDYKNIQIQTNGPDPAVPGNFTTVYVSAQKARTYGFEAEANLNITENLTALLSYSYLNAKMNRVDGTIIDLANSAAGPQDVSGNAIPQSPKHKLAANLGYTFDLGSNGNLQLSGTYIYTSAKYFDIFSNNPLYKSKGFEQVDLRMLYNDEDNRFTVIGYVKNLLDKDAANFTNLVNGTAQISYQLNQPRTYGVEVQVRF